MAFVYKVKDTVKNSFWDGYLGYRKIHRYSNKGKEFKTIEKLKSCISSYHFEIPPTWEFVKVEKIEREVETFTMDLEKLKRWQSMKHKIAKQLDANNTDYNEKNTVLGLVEKLIKREELDKTCYIILLPKEKARWAVSQSTIKEAREVLRGLGVKTRSFREYYGCFAMFDKSQALRAKVSLDIKLFVDLDELRKQ